MKFLSVRGLFILHNIQPILWVLSTGLNIHAQSVTFKSVLLGITPVQIEIRDYEGEQVAFVHVHENEATSLEAGVEIAQKYGGRLVTLRHSPVGEKNRFITFRHNKKEYRVDPNRIFTDDEELLRRNIAPAKGDDPIDDTVVNMVKKLADEIWGHIAGYPLIIALHNNKNEPAECKSRWLFWRNYTPESFNITSYVRKNDLVNDNTLSCSDIYINPEINNSEFFIVTERRDFSLLYQKRYNVVLQNEKPIDDGSMSVYAASRKKRYINSEAKHGKLSEQIKMLRLLLDL
jgi:hypothetical protein